MIDFKASGIIETHPEFPLSADSNAVDFERRLEEFRRLGKLWVRAVANNESTWEGVSRSDQIT
jgi:hypothetical protein